MTFMSHNLPRYLRTLRLQSALSQADLALLLGLKSDSTVSKFERGKIHPSLRNAIALEFIFDVRLREPFPRLVDDIEDAVGRQAAKLDRKLAGRSDTRTQAKRRHLLSMAARVREEPDLP